MASPLPHTDTHPHWGETPQDWEEIRLTSVQGHSPQSQTRDQHGGSGKLKWGRGVWPMSHMRWGWKEKLAFDQTCQVILVLNVIRNSQGFLIPEGFCGGKVSKKRVDHQEQHEESMNDASWQLRRCGSGNEWRQNRVMERIQETITRESLAHSEYSRIIKWWMREFI